MSIEKKKTTVVSSDGIHELAGVVYIPEGAPIGIFHVVHGMTEHIGRYDRFMTDMAEAGYVCFGYDNLGHGNTAKDDSELGYIAKKKGWELLARDVKVFFDAVKKEYGDLPYILMGHSMGSFIVRVAAERYVKPQKLIIMGTGGPNPIAGMGLLVIALIKLFKGEKHFSPLVDKLAFGSYNDRFGGGSKDDPKPWLTNDKAIRDIYYADRFCSFNFTVSAMGDLIRIMSHANRRDWFKNLSNDIDVLLVSGREDPVGNYGKGVEQVRDLLLSRKHSVDCKIYDNARHEILNDFTYEQVKNDIVGFCK